MANDVRLIDANDFLDLFYVASAGQDKAFVKAVEMVVEDTPTVDAVEVVRCKDCKHKTVTSDGMVCECALPTKTMKDYYIYGSTILARVKPDAFCSYGERREGE